MTRRRVRGTCPACGREDLQLTPGGYIVCCADDCLRATAVDELLADHETEHVVRITTRGYTLRHPLIERLDDDLLDCGTGVTLAWSLEWERFPPGRYRVVDDGRIFDLTPITTGAPE